MLKTINEQNVASVQVVAREVRRIRRAAGLTQLEVAQACGIYRTYLSRIENGTANPTLSVLLALATALHVSIRTLVEESGG